MFLDCRRKHANSTQKSHEPGFDSATFTLKVDSSTRSSTVCSIFVERSVFSATCKILIADKNSTKHHFKKKKGPKDLAFYFGFQTRSANIYLHRNIVNVFLKLFICTDSTESTQGQTGKNIIFIRDALYVDSEQPSIRSLSGSFSSLGAGFGSAPLKLPFIRVSARRDWSGEECLPAAVRC